MELTKAISYSSYNAYNPSGTSLVWKGWGCDKTNTRYGFAGQRSNGTIKYAFAYRIVTPKWGGDVKSMTMTLRLMRDVNASCNVVCSLTPFDPTSNTTSYTSSTVSDSQRLAYTTIDVAQGEYDYTVTFDSTSIQPNTTYYIVLSPNGGSTNYCTINTIACSGYVTYDAAASEVYANNGYFGSAVAITTTNDGMLHNISVEFGGSVVYTAASTGNTFSWTPAASLMSQIPNDQSASFTVKCSTEASSTPSEATATLYVPDSVKPSITAASVSPQNSGVPASWSGSYIQNLSKLQAVLQASAQYATIASWTFNCGAANFSGESTAATISINELSETISAAGTFQPIVTVTDSRGRSVEVALTAFTVLSYTIPSVYGQRVYRCDSSGTEDKEKGTYLRAVANAQVSDLGGKNTYAMYFEYKERSEASYTSVTMQSGVETAPQGGGKIDLMKSYNARIRITDQLNTVYVSVIIGSQAIPFHLKPSQDSGAGFGGYAQDDKTVELFNGWVLKVPDSEKIVVGDANLQEFVENLIAGGGTEVTYASLTDKPSINNHTLNGDSSLSDIGAEDASNKVSSVSSASTDAQYPSAKCVYDLLQNFSAGLFFCAYGSTTYAEISAAINAGKLPVVYIDDSTGSITVSQLYVFTAIYPESVRLQCNRGGYSENISVSSANVWSKSQTNLEQSSRKKSEITETTAKVTTNYPTVAAVKNYVDGICGNVEAALNALITGGTT